VYFISDILHFLHVIVRVAVILFCVYQLLFKAVLITSVLSSEQCHISALGAYWLAVRIHGIGILRLIKRQFIQKLIA